MRRLREHRYLRVETHMRASQAHHVFFQLLFDFSVFSFSNSATFFTNFCSHFWCPTCPPKWTNIVQKTIPLVRGAPYSHQDAHLYPQSGPKGLPLEAIVPPKWSQRAPFGGHWLPKEIPRDPLLGSWAPKVVPRGPL